MSRKIARESAYKLVFEYLFSKKANQRTFEILSSIELSNIDRNYMMQVYTGVIKNYDNLILTIDELSEGFSLDRIFKADLAALLIAVYEMNYMPDIPHSVSISEAVELVKRYSTEKSNQYVNGVLSTVYKKLNCDNKKAKERDAITANQTDINNADKDTPNQIDINNKEEN